MAYVTVQLLHVTLSQDRGGMSIEGMYAILLGSRSHIAAIHEG